MNALDQAEFNEDLYSNWCRSVNANAIAAKWAADAIRVLPRTSQVREGLDKTLTTAFDAVLSTMSIGEVAAIGFELGCCETWRGYEARAVLA